MKKQDGRFNERFGRNLLINGDFSVWQRGENFPAANGDYTADRLMSHGTVDVSRITGDISNGMTVGSSPAAYFIQKIEGYTQHSGKTYTMSIWSTDPVQSFYWHDDQGAPHQLYPAPTGETNGSWVRYANTFTVPLVLGDPVPSLEVRFDTIHDKGSDTHVTNWQLEEGSVATPFDHRPYGLELSLCQRYYQLYKAGAIIVSDGNASFKRMAGFPFITPMRVTPVTNLPIIGINSTGTGQITLSNPYMGSAGITHFDSDIAVPVGTPYNFHDTLTLDAEL